MSDGDSRDAADELIQAVLVELTTVSLDHHIKKEVASLVTKTAEAAMSLGTMAISMELVGRLGIPHEHAFPKERAEAIFETAFSLIVAPVPTMVRDLLTDEKAAAAILPIIQRSVDLAHAVFKGEYARRLDEALRGADDIVEAADKATTTAADLLLEGHDWGDPISVYGDAEAVDDGVIANIASMGLRRWAASESIYRPYNRMTRALLDAVTAEVTSRRPHGQTDTEGREWVEKAIPSEVKALVAVLEDTAEMGEPKDSILSGDWSGDKVWAVANEVAGYTLMFPSDY